jgi:APA family basic amino acid/polyamine antiporter
MGYFFPMDVWGIKFLAVASILFLTAVNCFGVKTGAVVQNIFTFSKMGALAALVLMSFVLSGGNVSNFSPVLPALPLSTMAGSFVLAMLAVLWCYDGWIEITFVAGEVKNPEKNIPRSLLLGVLICIVIYVVVNLALMYVLPLSVMGQSQTVAGDAAVKLMGRAGAAFIAAAVTISTFGSNNGFIFASPRIYYAMAKEGLFFRWLAKVHPKYHSPVPSLLAQAAISCALILSGSYDELYAYVVYAGWIFYAITAAGVIVLRS